MGKKLMDLSGQRFGKWTVVKLSRRDSKFNLPLWLCRCDCGTLREKQNSALRNGSSKSCGCAFAENFGQARKAAYETKSKEYRCWSSMKNRCLNPNEPTYARYGAMGITVCDEWKVSFEAFLNHLGFAPSPDHTIDRINTFGNYEPGNVRWATRKEQMLNRRDNHRIVYDGKNLTVSQWAENSGIDRTTLNSRLKAGWTMEKALKR